MLGTEGDDWAELTRKVLHSLYMFTCNYQGYTLINFIVLGLNMALLWVINLNCPKKQTLHCVSPTRVTRVQTRSCGHQNVASLCRPGWLYKVLRPSYKNKFATIKTQTPAFTRTLGHKYGPLKLPRISPAKAPKKNISPYEDDVETLDEITWGNDDSVSPIISPKAARHSQGFCFCFPEKAPGLGSKQKLRSPQRQRKNIPEIVISKADQRLINENPDKWTTVCKNITQRNGFSSLKKQTINKSIFKRGKDTNAPVRNDTSSRQWDTIQMKLKLPAKIKSPVRKSRKQRRNILVVKPVLSNHLARDDEKSNSELSKSFSGLWKSPSSRHGIKKFSKKISHPSYGRNMKEPNALIRPVSCSDVEISSSSSGRGKMSDQQSAANPSDSSIVFQRDSWIWFSPETRPSAENFASRQRKFRSQDPRVAALAEEIRRQEELNRDIERTAESLADSSSHSTGRGVKCKPRWQRGKLSVSRGDAHEKSKTVSGASAYMLKPSNKHSKYPNKGSLPESSSWSSSLRTASWHGSNLTDDKQRVTLEKMEDLPHRQNRKNSGIKISPGAKSKKTSSMRRSDENINKTSRFKLVVETDDIRTHNMTVLPLKQKNRVFDNQTRMVLGSSGELIRPDTLRPGKGHYPKQWTPQEEGHSIGLPIVISDQTSFSDVNKLDLTASTTNTPIVLSCPMIVPDSFVGSTSQDTTHIQSTINREDYELCKRPDKGFSLNIAPLQAEPRLQRSVYPLGVGHAPNSKGLMYRHPIWSSGTAGSAGDRGANVVSNPVDVAGKIAFGISTKSLGEQSAQLQEYRCQVNAESNLPAPEHRQKCITAGEGHSLVQLLPQTSNDTNRSKPEVEQARLQEIITAQVRAAIHKLFLESTSGTPSLTIPSSFDNSSSVPSHELDKCENGQTQNLLVRDNILPAASAAEPPGTMMGLLHHSQEAMGKPLNESPGSVKSEGLDTYLLESTPSKKTNNSHSCSNFSCSEAKAKNQKRTNIYTRAYYLGKRATSKKTQQETTKTPTQAPAKNSMCPWKKPYITWSKTVSLHLYSPTNKLSPRSQLERKKYEWYMRKLKPCLKVPHKVEKQIPKSVSLSEDSRQQVNSTRSVTPDSTSLPVSEEDKDVFNLSNCHQTSCSSALNQNTKKHGPAKCAHSKQSAILLSTKPYKRNNADRTLSHSSFKNPVHSDNYACTVSRNSTEVGRESTSESNFLRAVNCRKPVAYGHETCRFVATLSNNNSSSSTLPYQRPTPIISERSEPPQSQVSQLFFVTQANTHSNQVYSQNKDGKFSKCYHQKDIGNLQAHKSLSKLPFLETGNFRGKYLKNNHQNKLGSLTNNIFFSRHQMFDKRGSDSELLLRTNSFRERPRVSTDVPKHEMGIFEHANDYCHSDTWVTTAASNINFHHPQLLKSCVVEQPHISSMITKTNDLYMPPTRPLSPLFSSDDDYSSSDDHTTDTKDISKNKQTWSVLHIARASSDECFSYQTPSTPSLVTDVSTPDSGFDEPLSDTISLDHTAQCVLADSEEDNKSPAKGRSPVDDAALTEVWSPFQSPFIDLSDISEPFDSSSETTSLSVSDCYRFDNEFDTFDTDCDTFDTGMSTFDPGYDSFDN